MREVVSETAEAEEEASSTFHLSRVSEFPMRMTVSKIHEKSKYIEEVSRVDLERSQKSKNQFVTANIFYDCISFLVFYRCKAI